jgi:hypothetical protein
VLVFAWQPHIVGSVMHGSLHVVGSLGSWHGGGGHIGSVVGSQVGGPQFMVPLESTGQTWHPFGSVIGSHGGWQPFGSVVGSHTGGGHIVLPEASTMQQPFGSVVGSHGQDMVPEGSTMH